MTIEYTVEPLAGMGQLVWCKKPNQFKQQLGWVVCSSAHTDHQYRWQLLGEKVNKEYYPSAEAAVAALILKTQESDNSGCTKES